MYQIFGHNRSKDSFIEYGTYGKYCEAMNRLDELAQYLESWQLRTADGDLINWLSVYKVNESGEELVAAIYR